MCPACLVSAALIISSVMSAGGLAALVAIERGAKNSARKSLQNPIPKEESWEK